MVFKHVRLRGSPVTEEARVSRGDFPALGAPCRGSRAGSDSFVAVEFCDFGTILEHLWLNSVEEGLGQPHDVLFDVISFGGSVGWQGGRSWLEVEGLGLPVTPGTVSVPGPVAFPAAERVCVSR